MKTSLRNALLCICFNLTVILFTSCNETDAPKWCIEPPCGTTDPNATNVALFIPDEMNIGSIGIAIDDQETILSLQGWNPAEDVPFTCWQTIPQISANSVVILIYELDGEPIVGVLNVAALSTNELVIEIDQDAALIKDYEPCNDIL